MLLATIHSARQRLQKPLLTILAATLATANAMPTRAHDAPETLQVTVRLGDLQLTNEGDAALLYSRILAAANQVCVPLDAKALSSQVRHRDCVRSAVSQAVKTVNRTTLTAVHSKRSGAISLASSKT